jgi:predicted membrane-bound spermidine synthase
LEITAGRLLAPAVGISLETWTGIIGMVLVGFAVGDALGGRLVDRFPSPRLLALTLAASGIAVLLSLPVAAALRGAWPDAPIFARVIAISAAVLFLPCALLGAVAPIATRLTLRAVEHAGRTAGGLSAIATASSVLGVVLGGFFLLERFGVRAIVAGAGAALAALAAAVWAVGGRGADIAATSNRHGREGARRAVSPRPLLYLVPALSGAAVMAVELAGARIIAPLFGASLYTWASVIGVILLGISLGNALGGWLADRNPSIGLLGNVLIGAGAATLLVLAGPFLYSAVWPKATRGLLATVPPAASLPLLIGGMLFLPALLFGATSPIVIRIMLADVPEAGSLVGRVYAAQAAGSVAATFATGFLLISRLGARAVILLVAEGVLLAGVLLAEPGRRRMLARPLRVAATGAFALVLIASVTGRVPSPCLRESNYYCIRVLNQGEHIRVLALDSLFHSYLDLRDPTALLYEYEQGFAMIAADYATLVPGSTEDGSTAVDVTGDLTAVAPLRVLLIGGGGYIVPRYLRRVYPASLIEVVEIDPAVTAVAHDALGLVRGGMTIWHQDGRQFLMRRPKAAYDLIFGDTFRDAYSAPYHLATVEATAMVADALKPAGIFAVNVVDGRSGLFFRSYLRTLRQVFRYVTVLPVGANWQNAVQTTYVLLASQRPLDPERILTRRPPGVPQRVDLVTVPGEIVARLTADPAVLLTDDRAPVDQFLARLYAAAVREKQGP